MYQLDVLIMNYKVKLIGIILITIGLPLFTNAWDTTNRMKNIEPSEHDDSYQNLMEEGMTAFTGFAGLFMIIIGVITLLIGFGVKDKNQQNITKKELERICPKCGMVIPFDAKFCSYCSNKFIEY